jgi:hypothetical protein
MYVCIYVCIYYCMCICMYPGSIPGTTQKKVVDLERDPLSLVEYKLRSYLIEK